MVFQKTFLRRFRLSGNGRRRRLRTRRAPTPDASAITPVPAALNGATRAFATPAAMKVGVLMYATLVVASTANLAERFVINLRPVPRRHQRLRIRIARSAECVALLVDTSRTDITATTLRLTSNNFRRLAERPAGICEKSRKDKTLAANINTDSRENFNTDILHSVNDT